MPDEKKPEDDIVVEAAEEGAPAAEKPAAVTADSGIAELQRKLGAERAAREAAERRANDAAQREAAARGETQDSQLAQISTALDVVTSNAQTLENNYAQFAAAGEWAEAAKVQTQMARNESHRVQLEQGKAALEAAPKPKAEMRAVQPADPVEALAAQLTPRSADWVRAHPEFATDPKKYQQMLAAHNLVVARDIKSDSDEYFAEVEKTLGVGTRPAPKEVEGDALPGEKPLTAAAEATGGRGASPPAAPVTRGGTGTGSRPTVVRLTAAEREAAALNKMTDEEYARNKEALKKSGRLN